MVNKSDQNIDGYIMSIDSIPSFEKYSKNRQNGIPSDRRNISF